jgi:hypothetical protein
VVLTTDRVKPVLARSQRSSSHNYVVDSGYLGGSATAEGGMEITVLEDGRFLTAAQDKRWRKRVSAGESDSGDSGGFGTGAPIEVTWTMQPGQAYTLNVGAWVFCESQFGAGAAGFSFSQGNLHGIVTLMSLFDL